jgi:peptidoglycan/LPS O-acetylase OafA/YrhL
MPRLGQLKAVAKQTYLPKLDGLRAISIALVLIEHFIWSGHGIAAAGVTLFFVISGFLISSILMSYGDTLTVRDAAFTFYWRRTLRLFPIYYLCIATTTALNLGGMRQTWLMDALYLSNVKIALDGVWNGSSHFWSLAIEEQFYLLWFVVVMAVPRHKLRSIIVLCIVTGPIFRGTMWALGTNSFVDLLLPGVMDSLATGALLAYTVKYPPQTWLWPEFLRLRVRLVLVFLCLAVGVQISRNELLLRVILNCLVNLLAVCLVTLAIDENHDWRFDWLDGKTIRHFGKISYGIYVYHAFVPAIVDARLHLEWAHRYHITRSVRLFAVLAVTVGLAEASWYLIERPLLRLKDRMPYLGQGGNWQVQVRPVGYARSAAAQECTLHDMRGQSQRRKPAETKRDTDMVLKGCVGRPNCTEDPKHPRKPG